MTSILRKLFILSILLDLHLIIARPVSFQNLLVNENIASVPNISDTYVGQQGQSIYLIERNTEETKINQYLLLNKTLSYSKTYLSQDSMNNYWQMSILEQQIITFPIQVNKSAIIYNSNLIIEPNVVQDDVFFRVITGFISRLIFLSTLSGNIAYTTIQQLQLGLYHLFPNSHHLGKTYISLSPNQLYLCSTDYLTGLVSIWSVPQKMIIFSIVLNQTGIRTHTWSDDSSSLYIIGYKNGTVYTFNNNFVLTSTIFTNSKMIIGCFYNLEYNSIIALSYNSSAFTLIDLDSHNYSNLPLNFSNASNLKTDIKRQYFIVFNSVNLSLFRIHSACLSIQFYNSTNGFCQPCSPYCQSCNEFICFRCQLGYNYDSSHRLCLSSQQVHMGYNLPSFDISYRVTQVTFSFINRTFSMAGHRQFLNLFFELFSNFDHYVLYIYHNRTYGPNMQAILQIIHSSIDYRFQIISIDICKDYLGIDFDSMASNIDFKRNHSCPKFVEIQSKGEGFFELNIQYFLLNIPFMILTLLLYRSVFKMLFNYPISILLRKFSIEGIVILLLLQGNIQLFFFSFAADFLNLFSSNFNEKLFNFASIVMCFIFLLLATFGFYSFYYFYNKKSQSLYDNYYCSYFSAFFFLFFNGVLNIARGFTHRLAFTSPNLQVILLMLIEMVQSSLMIYCLKKQLFKSQLVAVLFISGNFSRILLDISLLFASSISMQNLDEFHLYIYIFNLVTFFIAIIQSFYELAIKIKKIITNKIHISQPENTKTEKGNERVNPRIEMENLSQTPSANENYVVFRIKTKQRKFDLVRTKEKGRCATLNERKKSKLKIKIKQSVGTIRI